MATRSAALLGFCLFAAAATGGRAAADPAADPTTPPAAGAAPVASAAPGTLVTPDGWVLTVSAESESLEPVASLTNSPWSREYIVDGRFEGKVTGAGTTKLSGGTLEAGYQIGCGIAQDELESISGITGIGGIGIPFATGTIFPLILGAQAGQQFKINLRPGTVNILPVGRKTFTGTTAHVNITGLRISIDSCAGQSFIRSYATFKSSTDDTDDVVTYVGVTRAV